MGTLGVQEMLLIFVVALVLFGPKKLPELGKTIGKAISEFRRASNELKSTFEQQMHSLERETESLKEPTRYPDYYESNDPTVSASEVPGAESHGAAEAATYEHAVEAVTGVEGTVPRTGVGDFDSHPDPHQTVETPQHS